MKRRNFLQYLVLAPLAALAAKTLPSMAETKPPSIVWDSITLESNGLQWKVVDGWAPNTVYKRGDCVEMNGKIKRISEASVPGSFQPSGGLTLTEGCII